MSDIFQQVMYNLGVRQIVYSAYHPENQGDLERFDVRGPLKLLKE